jgi:holin-like protein
VIGLLLLFAGLVIRGRNGGAAVSADLAATSSGLLSNLSLLFVPAGVGVITQLGVLGANLTSVIASILVSTALGLFVTGWVMQRLSGPDE